MRQRRFGGGHGLEHGHWLGLGLVLALVLALASTIAAAQPLPKAAPATVGFSAERLQRVDAVLQRVIADGDYAGASLAIARHGRLVYQRAFGAADLDSGAPVRADTIFRIYSMTKPVTAVALMMLYEEGKWQLDDPVSKYIPAFAGLKVHAGTNDDGTPRLEDPARPMTMRDLLRHTAGLTYGVFSDTPVDRLYQQVQPLQAPTLAAMIDRLAGLPLLYHPGAAWHYSVGVDVQGYIVEKLSGQSLPDFFRERIFAPLGMNDTAFHVPTAKAPRFATLYSRDDESKPLKPVPAGQFGTRDYAQVPGMPSGGAGLVSTLGDYLRFAQMLLNGGTLDGVRLLSPQTVALMRADHLPEAVKSSPGWMLEPGMGFGLGFAVVTDPAQAGALYGRGTYFWGGAAGTWFWIDPAFDVVVVGMVQRLLSGPNMHRLTRAVIYQALVEPEK
ncbi:MAG: class A beta-lactamase-related serine hydrolase [Alphaproteobacteria bacterium]|nr:MAG: class A beta-lactamase-related serine hydrolase [Alphaproteobacteria bacterium]